MRQNLSLNMKEKILFMNKFLQTPREIGSVTPSSKYLAQRMIDCIHWDDTYSIAELGAGTGAITKYIRNDNDDIRKVFLFEKNHTLREQLTLNYPNFLSFPDACQLEQTIKNEGVKKLDCILCGLPFFNFPKDVRNILIDQIDQSLKIGGYFIAFQYSLQMKKRLMEYFDIEKIEFVPLNFPPAFVYVCRKRG